MARMNDGLCCAKNLRQAMRLTGISVSLISLRGPDGAPHGFGSTTASALSLDPPSMIFTIRQNSPDLDLIRSNGQICLNAMGSGDLAKVELFTRPDLAAQRFTSPDWQSGWAALPYLSTAISNIFCEIEQEHSYGTERIFFARVMDVRINELKSTSQPDPLMWLNGRPSRLVYSEQN